MKIGEDAAVSRSPARWLTGGVVFLAWARHNGRTATLAADIGAEPVFIAVGRLGDRKTAVFRQLAQLARTAWFLARRRPRGVLVMAPPMVLVLLAVLYRWVTGARLIIDAHSAAVVLPRAGKPNRGLRVLGRHADAVLVHNSGLLKYLSGAPLKLLVAPGPPFVRGGASPPGSATPTFVYPCSWFSDEPIDAVVQAAALLPESVVKVTGRPRPERLGTTLPANVTLTGFLTAAEYDEMIASATAVLALTTRPDTMQRAGFEAMAYGRPLIASDMAVLRDYFPQGAIFTANDAASLAEAMRSIVGRERELAQQMLALRAQRLEEFAALRQQIRDALV